MRFQLVTAIVLTQAVSSDVDGEDAVDIQKTPDGYVVYILDDVDDLSQVASLKSVDSIIGAGVSITKDSLHDLAGIRLRELSLTNCDCDPSGYSILPTLRGLEVLALTLKSDVSAALRWIADCDELKELYLSESRLGDDDLQILSDRKSIRVMDLSGTDVRRIPESFSRLKSLRVLTLSRTSITDESVQVVADLEQLDTLGVDSTHVTDDGLRRIATMRSLRTLFVSDTRVTPEGIRVLANMKNLKVLCATRVELCESAVGTFSRFRQLRRLVLSKSDIPEEDRERLVRALPECQIVWLR